MKKLTFWNGVVIALLGSSIGSIGYFTFTFLCSEEFAIRLLTSSLAIAYILYLLCNTRESTGRITIWVAWFILLIIVWVFYPPLVLFIVLHVLGIWLIRSLYFYASLLASLADLGLNMLSITSAFWALHHTGSLFLTIWCFFLVQALFVYIPAGITRPNLENANIPDSESDFKRAYKTAEAAVRKLSTFN